MDRTALDQFAAAALTGLLARSQYALPATLTAENLARQSFDIARAMLFESSRVANDIEFDRLAAQLDQERHLAELNAEYDAERRSSTPST